MKKLLCKGTITLFEALKRLDKNGKRTLFIVDSKNRLKGVVTDGDVRRALIKGKSMNTPVASIMTKKVIAAQQGQEVSDIIRKLNPAIKLIPLVDEQKRVVDFVQFDQDLHIPVAAPSLTGNEFKYLMDAFLSTWISSSGEYIIRFEKTFSQYSDCQFGVAVSNGTAALHLALEALGIGMGDEVIVPDLTFAATINAVLHANATPVIVDVEKNYWTIDPKEIEKAITPKTKAIIPVHVYGQPCDMDAIMRIARKHKLKVIEDCAEAHGALYKNKKVGSFGDIGCYSFFGNKVITTGEGGMCVTNSKKLYERMRLLRNQGMSVTKKYWHTAVGYNYRMTNLQAAIGLAQLERIDTILRLRHKLETKYKAGLRNNKKIEFQQVAKARKKITWIVSALAKSGKWRNSLLKKLSAKKIDVRPFFYSLGTMPIYKKYLFSNTNSRHISERGFNLPTSIEISDSELKRIERAINEIA